MDFSHFSLEEVNALNRNTLMESLGIECVELGKDYLKFSMPVDHRTHQPMGILHGGASAALIETVGSFGSFLMAQGTDERPVGLSVHAEHLKAALLYSEDNKVKNNKFFLTRFFFKIIKI